MNFCFTSICVNFYLCYDIIRTCLYLLFFAFIVVEVNHLKREICVKLLLGWSWFLLNVSLCICFWVLCLWCSFGWMVFDFDCLCVSHVFGLPFVIGWLDQHLFTFFCEHLIKFGSSGIDQACCFVFSFFTFYFAVVVVSAFVFNILFDFYLLFFWNFRLKM